MIIEKELYAELKNALGETHFRIEHNFELKTVFTTLFGYQNLEDTQRGSLKVLELLQAHPGHYVRTIVDSTKVEGAMNEGNEWLKTVFMPKVIALGSKKSAVVVGNDVFSQMSMDDLITQIEGVISIGTFSNEEDAINWLFSE